MNAKSGSGSSGTFVWGLVAGLLALLGAGGLYMAGVFGSAPAPQETATEQPAEASDTAQAPAATDAVTTEAEPADDGAGEQAAQTPEPATEEPTDNAEVAEPEAPEALAAAPVLDQIFVEPDGNAVLSGNAEPGSRVNILLDGETVHSFTVDETGQFAEFLSIPFADDARGLVLETQGDDQTVRSDDYLIAALPDPEPEAEAQNIAEAEPAAPEAPTEDTAQVAPEAPVKDTDETPAAPTEESVQEEPETQIATAEPATEEEPVAESQPEVAQDQQVAILRSGEEGVELVQPPADVTPPDQVALDTIGYSEAGEVELTGRVQDESTVRLYLDNELVADLDPVDDGQWRGEIEGVDPGVYTLRVDEVSPEGEVVSRIETPFKREPIETLRAAEEASGEQTPTIRSVTVQKGDTLWAISRERFGDGILYVRLFEANREAIRDPDLIYPGQIFTIPE